MNTLLVALGGALGASSRYGAGLLVPAPWGTLAVNVVGSLLMGLLIGLTLAEHTTQRLLLGVGFLGGFTTFSAFSLDTLRLVEQGRMGTAAAYVVLSVGVAIAAVFAGIAIGRTLATGLT